MNVFIVGLFSSCSCAGCCFLSGLFFVKAFEIIWLSGAYVFLNVFIGGVFL